MSKSVYIVVFITTTNRKEAENLTRVLLQRRIIACSNIIGNVHSYFWWQGKKQSSKECLLIVKTLSSSLKMLIKIVRSIHSYDTPEIIALPIIAGSRPYLDWIKDEVRKC